MADDLKHCPFYFDRYINGVKMAEGVCVDRAKTVEEAMVIAVRIAPKGSLGEVPVLVLRPAALCALADSHPAEIEKEESK